MKPKVSEPHFSPVKSRKKRDATKPVTTAAIIQKIISLSVTTLELMPLVEDGDDINAAIMLDTLINEISSVTGKKLIYDCPLADATEAHCGYASKVVAELEKMSEATETCIQIIDASVENNNYVYGLTASRELFEAIANTNHLLCQLAPLRK